MGKRRQSMPHPDPAVQIRGYYATNGPDILKPHWLPLTDGGRAELNWLPQGPVLALIPWCRFAVNREIPSNNVNI
jgi:hypothetical protein